MTLDQAFNQYQGQSLLVPGDTEDDRGQCVQWADYVLHQVYNLPYHFGNAIDWWNNPGELLVHFDKVNDGSVKKGDFVIFNQQVGSVYGHIDVAVSDGTTSNFQGADSNWGGNKTVHLVQHLNPSYVLGSLRFKGEDMIENETQNDLVFLVGCSRHAYDQEKGRYIGKTWEHALNDVLQNQDRLDQDHLLQQIKKPTKLSPGLYQV